MDSEQTQSRDQSSARSTPSPPRIDTMSSADSKAQIVSEQILRENQPHNAVVMQLQRQDANAYVLYTNYKHYH